MSTNSQQEQAAGLTSTGLPMPQPLAKLEPGTDEEMQVDTAGSTATAGEAQSLEQEAGEEDEEEDEDDFSLDSEILTPGQAMERNAKRAKEQKAKKKAAKKTRQPTGE